MEKYYNNFIEEAELFFVKKFISSPTIEKKFSFCLDIIFNISKTPELDYSRGIIAFNTKYGQGKSFFFDVVFHRHKRLYNRNLFKKTSAKELANVFKEHGEDFLLQFISVKNLFIDDIGDEGDEKVFAHFNNKMNVISYVLLKRYEMWVNKGFRTFGTTNLSIQDIAKIYDGRVADRLMQMVYFEEFDFLSKGSFRQVKETRQLTQQEIQANWKKLEKPIEIKKIDVIAYLNELLQENDDYYESTGDLTWGFVKKVMLEKGYLKESDFDEISEEVLNASELLERKNARESVRVIMRNAVPSVRDAKLEEEYRKINRKRVNEVAENLITKKKFLEYKAQPNFKFE